MNNTNFPIISIVVPSLNQGAFIRASLSSLTEQKYPLLEIIVIDGGSRDDTIDIIKEFDNHIHYWVSEPDRGQSDAINKGFRKARGELVSWLNADDYLLPGALDAVAAAYGNNPNASFYYGDGLRVDEQGENPRNFFSNGVVQFNRNALARGLNYILQPATFINTIFLKNSGRLDVSLHYAMDTDLWLRLSEAGKPQAIPAKLAASREHAATKTSGGSFARIEEIRRVAEKHTGESLTPGVLLYFLDTLASALEDGALKTDILRFWGHANRDAANKLGVDPFMFPLDSEASSLGAHNVALLVDLTELDPVSNGGIQRFAEHACRILHEVAAKSRTPVVWVVNVCGLTAFREWIGPNAFIWPYYYGMQNIQSIAAHFRPTHVFHPLFGANIIKYVEGATNIAMMPDTMALDLPEVHAMFGQDDLAQRRRIYEDLKQFEFVITISRFSQDCLVKHTGLPRERIPYFHLASGILDAPEIPPPEGLPQEYLFYPANAWPHKRHELLFDIMRLLWDQGYKPDLVLTGWLPEGRMDELLLRLGSHSQRVHHLGRISDGQLRAVYTRAHALLFVSGFEGFGMPPLEAMQVGCPVVTARRGSLPEICGDAALYVEQDDTPSAWFEILTTELPRVRDQLVQKGYGQAKSFTWSRFHEHWLPFLHSLGIPPRYSTNCQPWESLATPYVLQCMHWWAEQFCGASDRAYRLSSNHNRGIAVVSDMSLTVPEQRLLNFIRRIKAATPFWMKHSFVRRIMRIK